MGSKNKHINIFEELIRVLDLKKRPRKDSIDAAFPSYNIEYFPDKDKAQKTINELIIHQIKINKRRSIHKIFYSLLVFGVFLLSLLLCLRTPHKNEEQIHNKIINHEQPINLQVDSVITRSENTKQLSEQNKVITSNYFNSKLNQKDTIKTTVSDTLLTTVYLTDTLVEKVIVTDTIHVNHFETKVNSGTKCSFPLKYRIRFEEKSTLIDTKHHTDILNIANRILDCQNINAIEIRGYYTRKFIFFTNKKLVLDRIENIENEIKKQNISSQLLRKSEKNLIKSVKSNKHDSSQLVEIILRD